MKYGHDEGAGNWVITDDQITVSEHMLRGAVEWAGKIEVGAADPVLFAKEARKMFAAFGAVLRNPPSTPNA